MYQTLVGDNSDDAVILFSEMLDGRDVVGALGVAQELWRVCQTEAEFDCGITTMLALAVKATHLRRNVVRDLTCALRLLEYSEVETPQHAALVAA